VRGRAQPVWVRVLGWAATSLFVSAAWVLFRAPDFATALVALRKLAFLDPVGTQWLCTSALLLLPVCFAAHLVGARRGEHPTFSLGTFRGMLAAFLIGWLLLFGAPDTPAPFIYFQF